MTALLKRLFKKGQQAVGANDNGSGPADTIAERTPAAKGKRFPKMFLFALFVFSIGAGFVVMSYLTPRHHGSSAWLSGQSAPIPPLSPQARATQPMVNVAQAAAPGQVQKSGPVVAEQPGQEGKSGQTAAKVNEKLTNSEDDDVFREFLIKHPQAGGAEQGATAEKKQPPVPTPLNNVFPREQRLPPVQVVTNASTQNEQIKEIKIYGITCTGQKRCAAITNEGTLKKGDKIGDESISDVTKNALVTNKRTVEFN